MVLQENLPFVVGEISYQKWFGGTPDSGKGFHVNIIFSQISEGIIIQNIYFMGMEDVLRQNPQNSKEYSATLAEKPKRDIILDSNPIKEMNNKKPTIASEIPYVLKANEAVIQYLINDKVSYYKIENMKELESVYYPSSKTDVN